MKTKFLLLIFFVFSISFYTQDIKQRKVIDSLIRVVKGQNNYVEKGTKEMLRLCTEIYYQSKGIGYKEGVVHALIKMSEIYINEQDYDMSLKKESEGILLCKRYNMTSYLSSFYLHKGVVYSDLGYTAKSRKLLFKSFKITKSEPNEYKYENEIYFYRYMALNIKKEKIKYNSDSLIFYLNKGYEFARKLPNNFSYKNLHLSTFAIDLSEEYYNRNDIVKTRNYLREFDVYMKNIKGKTAYYSLYYLILGNLENRNRNYVDALYYFKKSENASEKSKIMPKELIDIYSGKAEAYVGIHDFKNASLYAFKSKNMIDSIYGVNNRILNRIIPVDNNENSNTIKDLDNKKNIYIIIFLFLVFSLSTILYILKRKKEKKINVSTSFEIQKSEVDIDSLKDLKELIELAKDNDKSFHLEFAKVFPTFNQQLLNLNPILTHSDLEYCALIKLKFDTKEIATFRNVSVNSVVSKKYRIRKKLNISTNENIYTWMLNIK
ncbi:hypothetical protein J2O02_11885 [Elizabethkingia anophelis]|uniref:helix-turn-helix transcriptional regulator n=1 Tax=Elizabethkingia anophelis TaxID=1117645 RepID=UPI0020B1924C|nr:hypothetical protein [Elizabethkingia anophelis]UTF99022.1 hypothetical protein J2O04_12175 [Elizabethkingia anophelis]UTG63780.1 hypothetical protein J2O02_11885 [Elizabethkingia anophelis]